MKVDKSLAVKLGRLPVRLIHRDTTVRTHYTRMVVQSGKGSEASW